MKKGAVVSGQRIWSPFSGDASRVAKDVHPIITQRQSKARQDACAAIVHWSGL